MHCCSIFCFTEYTKEHNKQIIKYYAIKQPEQIKKITAKVFLPKTESNITSKTLILLNSNLNLSDKRQTRRLFLTEETVLSETN